MSTPEIKPAEFAILDADEVNKTLAGLDETTAVAVKSSFGAFLAKADEWMKSAKGIVITDASQLREMKLAREARLELRNIRSAVEKNRKLLKDKSYREGKAIDGMANLIEAVILPIEEELREKEEYAIRKEAARIEAIRVERAALLAEWSTIIHPDLGTMPQASFDSILADAKMLAEAKAAALAAVESERVAKEKSLAEERERLRLENEKLKAEAAAREAALTAEREAAAEVARVEREKLLAEQRAKDEAARIEREAIEAKARAERDAAQKEREAAEAKAKHEAEVAAAAVAKAEAEAKRLRDEQAAKLKAEAAAKKAAAAAPDRDKLIALAAKIRALEIPEFTTDEAKAVRGEIIGANERYAKWAEKLAANLLTEGKQP